MRVEKYQEYFAKGLEEFKKAGENLWGGDSEEIFKEKLDKFLKGGKIGFFDFMRDGYNEIMMGLGSWEVSSFLKSVEDAPLIIVDTTEDKIADIHTAQITNPGVHYPACYLNIIYNEYSDESIKKEYSAGEFAEALESATNGNDYIELCYTHDSDDEDFIGEYYVMSSINLEEVEGEAAVVVYVNSPDKFN